MEHAKFHYVSIEDIRSEAEKVGVALTLRRCERFARSGAGLIWGEAADSSRCFMKLENIDWREYPQPEIPTAGKL